MTPLELRQQIPAATESVYLNTGASGPSPQPVVEAATTALTEHESDAHSRASPYAFAFESYEETRETVASFLNARPHEIALTNSTCDGINVVAGAIEWSADSVIVRTDLEHPAGILPWERLRERDGVDIRVLETSNGRIDEEQYLDAVDGATLVCFSAITWTHGTRLSVTDLVEIAHEAGARVLVDAVQMPGQTSIDVTAWNADFVAAATHKWLLGPWGAGFLYVSEDITETLKPAAVGYRSVDDPNASPPNYKVGAPRFEVGTTSPVPYAGLRAAIATIEAIGIDTVESRIAELTSYLKGELPDDRLISPSSYESGLVSFRVDDPEKTVERLIEEGVIVRSIPPVDAVRASVHAFNTRADLDALVAGLRMGRS